ncbi:MAG: divergent PAP2 family protein [Chloroflexi bacterium]|nr:divergent PAP2 family protein [Chloroflexota bacterium]
MELLLSNKPLWIPLGAWAVAQTLKTIISSISERQINLSSLISMGGMPSAHATLVCALATSIALLHGIDSTVFALSVILAAIVMYDAAGLRQEISEQGTIINRMITELFLGKPAFEQHLRELIGHTKLEVLAGALLGIALAWLWT